MSRHLGINHITALPLGIFDSMTKLWVLYVPPDRYNY